MTPQRMDELLATCGPAWIGGQRELVRQAILTAVAEERHTVTAKWLYPSACTCDICRRVHEHIQAERLAL